MKLLVSLVVVIFVSGVVAQRNRRDIGAYQNGGAANGASSSQRQQGYGADIPREPLPVNLETTTTARPATSGYPRENPPNQLKLDAQPASNIEVRETTTASSMMMMMNAIPGTPGDDYPIFDTVPETKFDCKDQATGGYYADVDEGRCQVFHVCHDGRKFSFLCPNGTIFDQKVFVCNWWFNVDCAASKDFFNLNAQIGVVPEPSATTGNSNKTGGSQASAAGSASRPEPSPAASVQEDTKIASPNLNYIPPSKDSPPTAPSTAYIPPPTVAPNAAEAITNGIISSTPPGLRYLPPNAY